MPSAPAVSPGAGASGRRRRSCLEGLWGMGLGVLGFRAQG